MGFIEQSRRCGGVGSGFCIFNRSFYINKVVDTQYVCDYVHQLPSASIIVQSPRTYSEPS